MYKDTHDKCFNPEKIFFYLFNAQMVKMMFVCFFAYKSKKRVNIFFFVCLFFVYLDKVGGKKFQHWKGANIMFSSQVYLFNTAKETFLLIFM